MKERTKDLRMQEFQARGLKEPLMQLSSRCGDMQRLGPGRDYQSQRRESLVCGERLLSYLRLR